MFKIKFWEKTDCIRSGVLSKFANIEDAIKELNTLAEGYEKYNPETKTGNKIYWETDKKSFRITYFEPAIWAQYNGICPYEYRFYIKNNGGL